VSDHTLPHVSYAQNREDVLLSRVLPRTGGFCIDVGAADPVELSVTKWFYDRGWTGINVEPQARYFEALLAERPRDTNVNVLVSDVAAEVPFFALPDHPELSTTDPELAARYRAAGRRVGTGTQLTVTLADLCARHARGPIDFLKIDVEGHEGAVLRGADFGRWRPTVVLLEATEAETATPNHHAWEPLLLAADYAFATFDGLNRYYVCAERAELVPKLQLPINIFDEYHVPVAQAREREAAARAGGEWRTERARLVAANDELARRVAWLEGQLGLYRAA
jgi:FkbM family methyltransferase